MSRSHPNRPPDASRRRSWTTRGLVIAAPLLLALTLAAVWNTFRLSLPRSQPTSALTAVSPHGDASGPVSTPAGSVRWVFDAGEPLVVPPVAVGDRVYAVAGRSSATGRVVALEKESGEQVWEVSLGTVGDHPPVIADGILYVGTRAGRLLALSVDSGEEIWSFEDPHSSISGPPVVRDGVLYVGASAIYALDAATGEERWRHEAGHWVPLPVAFSQGVVAAIGGDNHLYLVDAWTGKRRLSFPLWFQPSGGAAVSGETVVMTGHRGLAQALDLHGYDIPMEKAVRSWWTKMWVYGAAGQPPLPRGYLWQQREVGGLLGRPVAADGQRVYMAVTLADRTGQAAALDSRTGDILWRFSTDSPVARSATLVDGLLLIGTERAGLYALDVVSGQTVWRVPVDGPVTAAPTISGRMVVIPSADGKLYAVE